MMWNQYFGLMVFSCLILANIVVEESTKTYFFVAAGICLGLQALFVCVEVVLFKKGRDNE